MLKFFSWIYCCSPDAAPFSYCGGHRINFKSLFSLIQELGSLLPLRRWPVSSGNLPLALQSVFQGVTRYSDRMHAQVWLLLVFLTQDLK